MTGSNRHEEMVKQLITALVVVGEAPEGASLPDIKEQIATKVTTIMDLLGSLKWTEEQTTLIAIALVTKVLETILGVQSPSVRAIDFKGRSADEVKRIYDEGGEL